MVGPKMHHCGMCERSFASKGALNQHMAHHSEATAPQLHCETCNWPFDDSLALETHKIQTGHGTADFRCDNCSATFHTQAALNKHRKFPSPCSDAFRKKTSPTGLSKEQPPRRPSAYVDLDAPKPEPSELRYDRSTTPSNTEGVFCHSCRKEFESQARYDRHALWCFTMSQAMTTETKPVHLVEAQTSSVQGVGDENSPPKQRSPQRAQSLAEAARPIQPQSSMYAALHHAPAASGLLNPQPTGSTHNQARPAPPVLTPRHEPAPPMVSTQPVTFICNIGGCQKQFKSEAGLKTHRTDAHGVGGQGLDLHGRDSWMLNQRVREQLKNQGLLRSSGPPPQQSRRSPRPAGRGGQSAAARTPVPANPPPTMMQSASFQAALPPVAPHGSSIGGLPEVEQANYICGRILRLLIQSDISIQHDGKMICGGIAWTRIGVTKQPEVVGMFDKLTHLPKKLQGKEYLPPPKTFKDEYQSEYPATDFQHSPDRLPAKAGLDVVAISCSKILLNDGCQEAIKMAAVDVLSCRILMNYLICTDPKASVKDWRTSTTGLSTFQDIEAARKAGYKVLRGWSAARAALWKFVDKETIILGYNLRSDLDTLRMIHGRAVDIAKCVEKAAGGPLSKAQLNLDSLCRDYPQVHLPKSSTFGRDCLQDAFAAREFGLWTLKQGEEFAKKAKQKSLEYQRVLGG